MTSSCRKYCLEAIQLSERFLQLTHDGHADCNVDRCQLLFGIVLDAASKIRLEAEKMLKKLETDAAERV